ncbi:hypothetical protein [Novosphingobium album (ex Liu et al. 2023)]|uniref:Uncharacterized protein n=1 Tax=Novosphingobium album (ex Liu et al. 2023) TaxID=3031130 RepID=A0ABT5WSQ7_9SPHN|nr:hypothetical protein [Novosphingobium album (ex Liu et al. 2023)]MDE8652781.1 hypothetical protein [Novosphingobium album (ex Liu et al. 2023)]
MLLVHSPLLERLLETASHHAENLLNEHDTSSPAFGRLKSDLELSPLLDKQLTAAALQVAIDRCLAGGIRTSLMNRFRAPVPGIAIEAQRRTVEAEVLQRGLPMELAGDYTAKLESQLAAPRHELPDLLWHYASLYGELWSDPRLGAHAPTRRIMLAMATTLRARSAQLVAEGARNADVRHPVASDRPAVREQSAAS